MEIRILIFLALVSVTAITNTVIIILAYRTLAGLTTKVTATVSELGRNTETRELIDSLQTAAERAASVTESAKVKMSALNPALERFQESYHRTLAAADSRLDEVAENLDTTAQNVRNVVSKPAFAVASFSAGFFKVLRDM